METNDDILQIDENRLDKECVRLPFQYRQASVQAADSARDLDEARAELDVREAELFAEMNRNPDKFGLEKTTNDVVKAAIRAHVRVQKIEKRIRELAHKAQLDKSLVTALEFKKRSLTNLVELHGAGYHAEVRTSEQGREHLKKVSRGKQARPLSRDRDERED